MDWKRTRNAIFVLLQARNLVEAIRLRANRLKVWKKGQLLAQTAAVLPQLHMAGRPDAVGFSHP